MPTLLVPDVPAEIVAGLSHLAEDRRRRLLAQAVELLGAALRAEGEGASPRLPDPPVASLEFIPPLDFPRPGPSEQIPYRDGGDRLPDLPDLLGAEDDVPSRPA